jgi:hypothetical protein
MLARRFPSVLFAVLLLHAAGCAAPQARPNRSAKDVDHETAPPALKPEQTLFGLRGNQAELWGCFEQTAPTLVRLSWQVVPEGTVNDIRVREPTQAEQATIDCLKTMLGRTHFGRARRPVQASWTFVHRLPKAENIRPSRGARDEGLTIEPSSPGWLDRFDIESTVNGGFGLYAYCFREGYSRNPDLQGRVQLRFVIDRSGSVAQVMDGGSDLADQRAIDCIAEGLFALKFPPPQRGEAHVLYPILFNDNDE